MNRHRKRPCGPHPLHSTCEGSAAAADTCTSGPFLNCVRLDDASLPSPRLPRHPERHLPTDQGRADLLAFCRRSLPGYLLRFRVSPQARLSGLNDRRPLLAPALHAEAKPRLLHAQEQFTQRRVFGVRRTQPACGRALHAAPIRQIPTAILRGCSGTGFLNDEAFRTATPASPTNRDIVCERKDIIHQSQAADTADLALGAFEQNGDHMPALRTSNSDKRFSLRQSQSNARPARTFPG